MPFLHSLSGRRLAAVAGAAALLVAAALIAASQLGGGSDVAPPAATAPAGALLSGIAQDGAAVGSPIASVTLVEFADLQCPFCARFALGTLPVLIEEYVGSGRLKIVFTGLAFLGPESETALRAAVAAGGHNRLWNVVDALYRAQGAENGGWVSDELLTRAFVEAGLDAALLRSEMSSAQVDDTIAAAARLAESTGVRGTPSFLIGRTGSSMRPLEVNTLDPAPFRAAIDRLLRT